MKSLINSKKIEVPSKISIELKNYANETVFYAQVCLVYFRFCFKKTIYPIESAIFFKVNVYAKWLPMLKLETFLVWSKLD